MAIARGRKSTWWEAAAPMLFGVIVCCAASLPMAAETAGGSGGKQFERQIKFEGHEFTYYVYQPAAYDAGHPPPVVVALHGSGGTGLNSIAAWKKTADDNGILLVCPSLPPGRAGAAIELHVPLLVHAILDAVKTGWAVDAGRVYASGHSAGGIFAFDLIMLDSNTYAAAAIHAAAIDPDFDWIIKRADHKAPIALYIGDRDQYFTLGQVRRTRDRLLAAGFQLHYVEMPHHDHTYGPVADQVNADAWKYISQFSLAK